jgi:hypothetical protein
MRELCSKLHVNWYRLLSATNVCAPLTLRRCPNSTRMPHRTCIISLTDNHSQTIACFAWVKIHVSGPDTTSAGFRTSTTSSELEINTVTHRQRTTSLPKCASAATHSHHHSTWHQHSGQSETDSERQRETDRDRQRETDKEIQTDRQRDRETDRQTETEIETQRHRHRHRQRETESNMMGTDLASNSQQLIP